MFNAFHPENVKIKLWNILHLQTLGFYNIEILDFYILGSLIDRTILKIILDQKLKN